MNFQPLLIITGILFAAVGGGIVYFLVKKPKDKS